MRATDHTHQMLQWMARRGIDRFDLAVRRANGCFVAQHSRKLDANGVARCLPWLRAENVRGAEIYVRPARGYAWPLVLLDDVPAPRARAGAMTCAVLAIRTSSASQGGCHLWLATDVFLDEEQRKTVQQHLCQRWGSDPASVSGEHWGRLAGFKNHKRNGTWVDVLHATEAPPWSTVGIRPPLVSLSAPPLATDGPDHGPDQSPSGRDWAWVLQQLENNTPPAEVLTELVHRARQRDKPQPVAYANRTLAKALDAVSSLPSPRRR